MITKEKFKHIFKWAKIVLIEAFEQLQKKYQELERIKIDLEKNV